MDTENDRYISMLSEILFVWKTMARICKMLLKINLFCVMYLDMESLE